MALNNAVTASLRPVGREIAETRLRRLREYAQALIAPLTEHMVEQTYTDEAGTVWAAPLAPEEVVAILSCAALFMHLSNVAQTDHVPQAKMAETLFR